MRTPHGSRLAANRSIAKRECSRLRLPQVLYSNFQGSLKGESYLTPPCSNSHPPKEVWHPSIWEVCRYCGPLRTLPAPFYRDRYAACSNLLEPAWLPCGSPWNLYTCTLLFVHCIHIYIYYVHTHTYIIDIYIYTGKGLYIYYINYNISMSPLGNNVS